MAQFDLPLLRFQLAFQQRPDVVGHLVDDVVAADLDLFLVGQTPRRLVGDHVEADDDGLRRMGQHHVRGGDGADRAVQNLDLDFRVLQLGEFLLDRFDRASHVGTDDQIQVDHVLGRDQFAFGQAPLELLERHAGGDAGQRLLAVAVGPLLGDLPGLSDFVEHVEAVAGGRSDIQPRDIHRSGRAGFLHPLAGPQRVVHRLDATVGFAAHHDIADVKRSVLDDQLCNHAAPRLLLGFQANAHGMPVGVGLVFVHFRGQENRFQQIADPVSGGGAGADDFDIAAPFAGQQILSGQLLHHAVGVRPGQVHFVQGHDNRHAGCAGVADRFFGLRHHAVFGGDHQHGDVGHVGAAGAHFSERLVPRRIDERNLSAVFGDLIRPDVLRDSACLAGNHVDPDDIVQQRRLAVIDVAQERHDGRPRLQGLRLVLDALELVDQIVFQRRSLTKLDVDTQLRRQPVRRFRIQFGVDIQRRHAERHQGLEHHTGADTTGLGEATDGARQIEHYLFFARRRRVGGVAASRQRARPPSGRSGLAIFFVSARSGASADFGLAGLLSIRPCAGHSRQAAFGLLLFFRHFRTAAFVRTLAAERRFGSGGCPCGLLGRLRPGRRLLRLLLSGLFRRCLFDGFGQMFQRAALSGLVAGNHVLRQADVGFLGFRFRCGRLDRRLLQLRGLSQFDHRLAASRRAVGRGFPRLLVLGFAHVPQILDLPDFPRFPDFSRLPWLRRLLRRLRFVDLPSRLGRFRWLRLPWFLRRQRFLRHQRFLELLGLLDVLGFYGLLRLRGFLRFLGLLGGLSRYVEDTDAPGLARRDVVVLRVAFGNVRARRRTGPRSPRLGLLLLAAQETLDLLGFFVRQAGQRRAFAGDACLAADLHQLFAVHIQVFC